MKSLSVRTRLLVAFWILLLVCVLAPSTYFHHQLHRVLLEESEKRLHQELTFLIWSLKNHVPFPWLSDLDDWCTQAGSLLGLRITYIAQGGRVVADSDVPYDKLGFMEDHWNRPEVVGARQNGFGFSLRSSDTIRKNLLYGAMPVSQIPNLPSGILRIAMPVSQIKATLDQQRRHLWWILGLSFMGTGLLAFAFSRLMEKPLTPLLDIVRSLGRREFHRPRPSGYPVLDALGEALQKTSARVEGQIKALEDQRAQLQAILEGMKEGVFLLDAEGRIQSANRAALQIQRAPRSPVGLKPLEVFLNPDLQKACDQVLAGRDTAHVEIILDPERHFDVHVVSLRTPMVPQGAVVVLHDITELKRLARIRRDFVANVSHELRTPLTAVKGYAETLLESPCVQDSEARMFVETILRKANHMTRMVNDLLTLTRLESQPSQVPQEAVDAAGAVAAAVETCYPEARKRHMDIHILFPQQPLWVRAHRDALVQVFQNLLDNAIRYSHPSTPIRIRAQLQADTVLFTVEDEGPGIPLEHQARVFERFYRVDRQKESPSGSTGLGLAICRHIVQNMGGRVWVESPVRGTERGTAFCFTVHRADESERKEALKG
ncbi:sensor histidine kinase [Desulfosoma sp.]|uniref:sensor histidine kinase n=1 Tax=Desulfosoma sp. TaxID=2603217 RepID=UPI00404A7536